MAVFKPKFIIAKKCGHICEGEICDICQDPDRDQTTICIVEDPKDVFAMEKVKNIMAYIMSYMALCQ